jgi:microcystin-dependent protein
MSQPYIGQIILFAGNFEPVGWAFCDGRTLAISQNSALFNLIGTTYGGDGQQTFNLPNLAGRFPIHNGQGPGLSNHILGEIAGAEVVTLQTNQLPAHNHTAKGSPSGNVVNPAGRFWSTDPGGNTAAYTGSGNGQMAADAIGPNSGGQPHDNLPPFLAMNYIIALEGIFPSQN